MESSAQILLLVRILAPLLYLDNVLNCLLMRLKVLYLRLQKRRTAVRGDRPAVTCLSKFLRHRARFRFAFRIIVAQTTIALLITLLRH